MSGAAINRNPGNKKIIANGVLLIYFYEKESAERTIRITNNKVDP